MKRILLVCVVVLCAVTVSAQQVTRDISKRSPEFNVKSAQAVTPKLEKYTVSDPTVYTDEAAFLAAIGSDYFLEEFDSYSDGSFKDSVLTLSSPPFSDTIGAYPQGWLFSGNKAMSHLNIEDTLLILNNKRHINFFGGYFFSTNMKIDYAKSPVTIYAGNYSYTYTPDDSITFRGFIFKDTIPYFKVKGTDLDLTWGTIDHLYLGDTLNFKPEILSTVPVTIDEDTPLALTFSEIIAKDVDGDTPLTITVLEGDNYTVAGNTITPVENYFGPLQVGVSVSDGLESSPNAFVSVTVNSVNDAPAITSTAPLDATETTLYTYTVVASDVETGTLTYSLSGQPTGMEITNNVITWTPATGVTTSGEVTLTVSDGALTDTEKFTIAVSPLSDIETNPSVGFSLRPNPATAYVTVNSPSKITSVQLINVTGKIILTKNGDSPSMEINEIAALPKGIYFVRVKTITETKVLKLIKQ